MAKSRRREIPRFETPIIETHCHLDYLKNQDVNEVLDNARRVGVDRFITISVSPENFDTVAVLADSHETVWATQGVHPHEADAFDFQVAQSLRRRCRGPKIVAVGEIGLDYHYEHSDRDSQRNAFEAQLDIAAELDLPVVIHTRDADQDTRDILANFTGQLRAGGVIHSFTSGMALAEYCLAEGFTLGFNGITTFKKADNVRAVVKATPLEQLVLETDAPYLTPEPYRGRPNEPCYLPFVGEQIASLKGIDVESLLQHARANSLRLFFNA